MSYNDELSLLEEDNILDIIQEAPGDEEGGGETVDANPDAANDNADQNANADDTTGDNDQNQNDDTTDNNRGDQENDDNFDIDDTDTDNTDNNDEGGGDDNADDNNDAVGGDTGNEDEPEQTEHEKEINSAFDKIYDELTPEEKKKRDTVLRHQYKDLYMAINGIIDDTSQFPNTSDTNKTIRLLIRNLRDFKEYISFYMTDVYSTKSHLENKIQYDTFMQILHAVEKIYADLKTAMGHKYDSYGREIDKLNTRNY